MRFLLLAVFYSAIIWGAHVAIGRPNYRPALPVSSDSVDGTSLYVGRFAKISLRLNVHERYGFITNRASKKRSRADYHRRWYMTQYALSPVLLVPGRQERLIVADLGGDIANFCEKKGYRIIEDFGDGVLLLENDREALEGKGAKSNSETSA